METVKGFIDYAYPMMLAERALKGAHEAVLSKDFDSAVAQTLLAIAEARRMLLSLKEMQELYK